VIEVEKHIPQIADDGSDHGSRLPGCGQSLPSLKNKRPTPRAGRWNPDPNRAMTAVRILVIKSRYFLLLQKISAKSNTHSWNSAHKMGY
jgi:hypothetical protein